MEWKVVLGISLLLIIFILAAIGPFIAHEFHHLGTQLHPAAQH